MPGLLHLIFCSLLTSWTLVAASGVCQNDADCFYGNCDVQGKCRCQFNCQFDFFPLCGEDGIYYINYCYLKSSSCIRGAKIEIHENRAGVSDHCAKHKWAKIAGLYEGRMRKDRICETNHCENDGICLQDSRNQPYCRCLKGFEGERCLQRSRPQSSLEVYRTNARSRT